MNRDQILQYLVEQYGSQEPLAQPIDKGFNRLAWAVPYMMGATGLVFVGVVAMRWSRRSGVPDADAQRPGHAPEAADAALEARLNDELSNLD